MADHREMGMGSVLTFDTKRCIIGEEDWRRASMIPFRGAGLSISNSSWFASAKLWQARPSLGRSCAGWPGLLCPSQAASAAPRLWPPPSVHRFGCVRALDGARSPSLASGQAPSILLQSLPFSQQPGPCRVQMHVIAHCAQIAWRGSID